MFGSGGCFDEIVPNPGASASESSGTMTTTSATTATGSVTAATAMGASETSAPDDNDSDTDSEETSSGSSSGGDHDPLDGLCPSAVHDCGDEVWTVAPCDGCDELSAVGKCVLEELSHEGGGMFTTLRCEPDCIRDHYVLRPGGPEVMIESKLLDGEGEASEVVGRKMCTRVDASYFNGCLSGYTSGCADPGTWFASCADFEATECPFVMGRG